ncbi:MAG: DUF3299 domain-containing protein [Elainellaceae cyanobacterium]
MGLLVVSLCLVCGLATSALAQSRLTWEDLQPSETTLQNPYAHLSTEQTYDLATLAQLQTWLEESKAASDSLEAQEILRLKKKLRDQDLDVVALLSRVEQARAYWQYRSRSANSEWVGQTVQLEGYVLPLNQQQANRVTEFLLVPYVGACIHVPPPPPNQIVYIKPEQALPSPGLFAQVVVEGALQLKSASYELFRIDGSRPVEVSYALTLDRLSLSETPGAPKTEPTLGRSPPSGPWWQRLQTAVSALLTEAVGNVERQRSPKTFLLGLLVAFSYGVLHTLGPGHGKAIIIAYFVGEGGSLQRGLTMGTRIAVFHVLSAIGVALLVNLVLRQSAPENYWVVKLVSYAAISIIGSWMLWRAIPWRHSPRPQQVPIYLDDKGVNSLLSPNLTQQVTGIASSSLAVDCPCLTCIEPKRASDWLSIAIGSVPCSGALLILLYGSANKLLWPSIAMVIAISVGMAITLAYIGVLALTGRNYAARQFDQRLGKQRYRRLQQWLKFAGACSVMSLGFGLFSVTLASGR